MERRLPFSVGDTGFICLCMVSGCKEQRLKVREHAEKFLQKLYKSWTRCSMMRDGSAFPALFTKKRDQEVMLLDFSYAEY